MTPVEIAEQTRMSAEMWRLNDLRIRAEKSKMKSWQIKQSLVSAVLGIVLTALSYAVAYAMSWDVTFNWLDATAVATSYSCTWLCVVQSRLNYLIGAVSVALYSALFFRDGYNALAWFNLYMVGSLVYGYFRWGRDSKPRLVTLLGLDRWTVVYAAIGISIAVACVVVNQYFPGTFRPVDIWITALSGVAQALLDNKRLQTWPIWFIVNILSIYTFYQDATNNHVTGLYIVALQYVMFTVNTGIGYVSWKRSLK